VIFSPDGSGILVVPKLRDYEIQRTAGGFVLEKCNHSAPTENQLSVDCVCSLVQSNLFAIDSLFLICINNLVTKKVARYQTTLILYNTRMKLDQVETIEVHDLVPSCDKVFYEFVLRIGTTINFSECS
jgi:hypothetical protein